MYISRNDLETALNGTIARKNLISKQLAQYGNEYLVCRLRNNRVYYSEKLNGKEVGITKNKDRIYNLMMKEYLLRQLKVLYGNEKAVSSCLNNYQDLTPDIILDDLRERFPSAPIDCILHKSDDDWSNQPYEKNPYHKEHLQFLTTNSVLVRSKSEREIANTLEALNIPYQSDVLVKCSDTIYYADFIIRRPDNSKVIWEHFGRENDSSYMSKNQQRIKDYMKLGYRPWDNLIWTLDSDLKDSNNIRKIINRFLL